MVVVVAKSRQKISDKQQQKQNMAEAKEKKGREKNEVTFIAPRE